MTWKSAKELVEEGARKSAPAIDRLARLGFAAKGLVTAMVGGLALLLALGRPGGDIAGPADALRRFQQQPLGWVLLGILALGLWAYALWKVVQMVLDPENKGTSLTGLAERAAFGITAIGYVALGIVAVKLLFRDDIGGGLSMDAIAAWLLARPFGRWLTGLVGGIVVLAGVLQLRFGLTAGFRHILRLNGMSAAERYTMTVIGGAGYLALGVISVVLGYFLIQVALTYQPSRAGSWRDALGFLGSLDHGRWLLGAVAGGIVCYGLYFLLLVRYRQAVG